MIKMKKSALKQNFGWIILALCVLMVACGTPQSEGASPTMTVPEIKQPQHASPCFAGITPGTSTRQDVINQLGEPLKTSVDEQGIENLIYASSLDVLPNSVLIQQDKVVLIGKLVKEEGLQLSAWIAQYGEPEQMTYSFLAQHTKTYLYPQYGFSVIVSETQDTIIRVQCFVPMTLQEYLDSWGSELPLEDPYIL